MGVVQASPHGLMNSAVPFPEWVDEVYLGSAAAETYTVPQSAGFCLITSNLPFWGRIVTGVDAAVVPTDNVSDGTGSFYIAAGVQCKLGSGKSLSMIRATAAATTVSIGVFRA